MFIVQVEKDGKQVLEEFVEQVAEVLDGPFVEIFQQCVETLYREFICNRQRYTLALLHHIQLKYLIFQFPSRKLIRTLKHNSQHSINAIQKVCPTLITLINTKQAGTVEQTNLAKEMKVSLHLIFEYIFILLFLLRM